MTFTVNVRVLKKHFVHTVDCFTVSFKASKESYLINFEQTSESNKSETL